MQQRQHVRRHKQHIGRMRAASPRPGADASTGAETGLRATPRARCAATALGRGLVEVEAKTCRCPSSHQRADQVQRIVLGPGALRAVRAAGIDADGEGRALARRAHIASEPRWRSRAAPAALSARSTGARLAASTKATMQPPPPPPESLAPAAPAPSAAPIRRSSLGEETPLRSSWLRLASAPRAASRRLRWHARPARRYRRWP